MSGTGGSGANFGGGGGIPSTDCKNVSIKTNIISPDPSILSTLAIGEMLDIQLQSPTGPIVAVTDTKKIVGSVFTVNPKLLIDCIAKGYEYHGRILKKDGADCQILITSK